MKNKKPLLKYPKINEIDYSYQKTISFSQFQIYSQCPHRWYKQYVERVVSTPPNINMVFGTAIHYVFQHYLTIGYNKSFAAADREDIENIFYEKLKDEYKNQYDKTQVHFSTAEELGEFYTDGVEIIKWFKKKRKIYFPSRNILLIGVEIPLQKEIKNNLIFNGFIDLVLYDKMSDEILIYDLKTSTKGWNEYNKKDEVKISQLLLYKQFFSELYNFPIEKIKVEFLILKRKAEPTEYQEFPKRIQEFKPADGKIKMKKSNDMLNSFIENCFNDNGEYIIKEHTKNISKLCSWCPLNNTSFCVK